MKKSWILMMFIIIIIQGCSFGPRFRMTVDSISAPEAISKTNFILFPGLENIDTNSLQYREYAAYIERALTLRGFTKAKDFGEANIAIFLGYGIGDPQKEQYSYSLPTWGKTGVSSSYTYGKVTTKGNSSTYSGTTTYTPSYGVTGSKTYSGTRTNYFRYVWLYAFDLDEYKKTEKKVQLWKTTVTSTGSSGDLRQVFPILVAASSPYIGENTEKQVKVILSENDKQVIEIKGHTK